MKNKMSLNKYLKEPKFDLQGKKFRKLFGFTRNFDKLKVKVGEKFTTIRSIHYAKKHDLTMGSIGWIFFQNTQLFLGKIISWSDMKICEMPINLLKQDVAPEEINSHADFVEKINQLYKEIGMSYANNKLETVKRIFVLERVM